MPKKGELGEFAGLGGDLAKKEGLGGDLAKKEGVVFTRGEGGVVPPCTLCRYHDLLSVVEDDLGSSTEQHFTEVCHKIWNNSKNNDKLKAELKVFLFQRIALP